MVRFLKRLKDAHGKAAQAGDVFRAEAGAYPAAILIVIPVDDVMYAFDAPMPAVDGQDAFGRSILRCAARDPEYGFIGLLAGLFVHRFALDQKDLPYMREVEVAIERGAAPNASRLDAAMIRRRDLDEIRRAALLKQQGDIAFQRRLIALDREKIMRLLLDYVVGDCALGEQGVGGDVLACDPAVLKQRNRHADFISPLLLIAACDRQSTCFF